MAPIIFNRQIFIISTEEDEEYADALSKAMRSYGWEPVTADDRLKVFRERPTGHGYALWPRMSECWGVVPLLTKHVPAVGWFMSEWQSALQLNHMYGTIVIPLWLSGELDDRYRTDFVGVNLPAIPIEGWVDGRGERGPAHAAHLLHKALAAAREVVPPKRAAHEQVQQTPDVAMDGIAMPVNIMSRIFISYAREDEIPAERLYRDLQREGFDAWIDTHNLLAGSNWSVEIRRAIRASQHVVLLLSKNSMAKRGFVHREIREALDVVREMPESEIFLIPARLELCDVTHEDLGRLHWVDLFPDWDSGLSKLIRSLRR